MAAIDGVNQEKFTYLRLRQSVKAGRSMPLGMGKSRNQSRNERYRQMDTIKWAKDRASEPSSYTAIGLGVMGVGIIVQLPILIYIGIIGGVVGFVLKERGVI
jgi:hypothetical protein